MRLISYNLRKHRAVNELDDLVTAHDADVLCLQECDTGALPAEVGGLVLAQATSGNRLGLAVYYRSSLFRLGDVRTFGLKKSLHDRVLRPAHERVLGVALHNIDTGRDVIVGSFHAAPLTALNSLRRNQIRAALDELQRMGENTAVIMAGDYNYPIFKENLGQTIRAHGYSLSMSDDRTYTRYRVFRGHYDFVTSAGLWIESVKTLPQRSSDHRPILVEAWAA